MKKKILVIAIVACVLTLSIVGSSMAYFTDTDKYTNVFTVGKVDIQMTEARVVVDGNNWHIVKDDPEVRQPCVDLNYSTIRSLWPGQRIYKDPRIENIGSEDAYVGAIITITGIQDLLATAGARDAFFVGGALDDTTNNTVVWAVSGNDLIIYVVVNRALAKQTAEGGVDNVVLFENIVIPAEWNNEQMAKLTNMKISVEAYATQRAGFEDAVTALTKAFPGKFDVVVTPAPGAPGTQNG